MHIVTIQRLQQATETFRETAPAIGSWIKVVKSSRWQNFVELRESFPDADNVGGFVVFNIMHNRYRLITAIHDAKWISGRLRLGHIFVSSFVTHKEYDRWSALTEMKKAEWLHF